MKTLLLALSLLIASQTIYAQDNKTYGEERHELNIGFFNVTPLNNAGQLYPYLYDAIWYPYYYENPMVPVGLQYKFHFWDFAVRAGFGVNYKAEENNQSPSYQYERDQVLFNTRVGLQYGKQWNRVKLYGGVDFFMRQKKNTESTYYQWTDANGAIQFSTSKYRNSQRENGIAPFIGTQVYITKNLSLGIETSLDFARYHNSTRYNLDDPSVAKGFAIKSGNLSQISVNVHF